MTTITATHVHTSTAITIECKAGPFMRVPLDDRCAAQLAPLASQHHLSDYNRLKFGPKGCPIAYVPLTLCARSYMDELEARQAPYVPVYFESPTHDAVDPKVTLEDNLADAMDTPLTTQRASAIKTSETHPINISAIIPPELLPLLSPYILRRSDRTRVSPTLFDIPKAYTLDQTTMVYPALDATEGITVVRREIAPHLRTNTAPNPMSTVSPTPSAPTIGNLYLSSCPGKKVRLGPLPEKSQNKITRAPIARSLPMDLQRIKSLGIGLLICLLPTDELALLGTGWPAYLAAAHALGLSVLRIPVVEGLGLSGGVHEVDRCINWVIENWTRQGKGVLVHCRGGVGRAGVWAACWAMRLGLVGPIHSFKDSEDDCMTEPKVRRDTLAIVEKAVGAIRRRRSVKAVETFEQVKFLVQYVDHLRGSS